MGQTEQVTTFSYVMMIEPRLRNFFILQEKIYFELQIFVS